ncbi:hypothetical protein J556_2683 [Acinetobacter baumannii 1096934]|nr:hypothetical protein J556_2683 [Acinetobacter baumannii 1096934]
MKYEWDITPLEEPNTKKPLPNFSSSHSVALLYFLQAI